MVDGKIGEVGTFKDLIRVAGGTSFMNQNLPVFSEMMRSCQSFPYVSRMLTIIH
jgi:hypothetical protein